MIPPPDSSALEPASLTLPAARMRVDRRSHQSRDLLLRRVRGEFTEMPCLSLTVPQAMRLFNLREDICRRILAALVSDGVLWERDDNRYVSRSIGL
jgi:hypothetical protein